VTKWQFKLKLIMYFCVNQKTLRMILFDSIFKSALLSTAVLLTVQTGQAQTIQLTTSGMPYTQDFDALSNSAGTTTNNITIPGWYLIESGGGPRDNEQYGVDTGGSGTGDTYSYGAAGSTERALGYLQSGTLIPSIGAAFTNTTGATITSLEISYYGEEWRLGTAGRTDQLIFEYSTNSTDLVTGSWTGVTALNFVTPDIATIGAKNGNAAAERALVSSTITALSIPDGATFWIRWTDMNVSGADDGLAVDDFSLTPQTSSVVAAPEMDIQGNSVSIMDGSAFPVAFNDTYFADQSVCAGAMSHTFTILNTGNATLNLNGVPTVSLSGAGAADFTVTSMPSTTVAAGGSSFFVISYDPSVAGSSSAIVEIANDDSDENPYEFYILGTAVEATVSASSQTNIACNGGNDGALSVTATGTGTLSYDWEPGTPTGDGTSAISGLTAGVYTVTVTDQGTCQAMATFTVTEPAALILSATATNSAICSGGSATLSATANGGTGSITYTWSTAENTASITVTPTVSSTYTIDVSDANNCQQSATVSVTVNNLPLITVNNGTICAGESFTIMATGADTYTYSGGSNVVNPGADVSYTVTGTDSNGCTGSAMSNVTVNALPVITVNSGTICAGESFTIMATGADTYTYSGGSNVVNPGADATYTVTGTSVEGCVDVVGVESNVTVNALPAITAVTNNTLLCADETATLSAIGADTYTWNTTETTADIAVSPTVTTDYTVTGTDMNGCMNSAVITQDVSTCTGIKMAEAPGAITVFPNPSNGEYTIDLPADARVEITNQIGRVIYSKQLLQGKNQVTINDCAEGIYFMKTTIDGKVNVTKIVKQ
jgi:hemin uptake protein HemP